MSLILKIVTPTGITLDREVSSVVLPSSEGEIEILPNHQPLITILNAGELVAKNRNSSEVFVVDAGFAKVYGNTVTVLTDESLNIDAVSISELEEAVNRAQTALNEAREKRESLDPQEIEMLDAKVKYQMAKKLTKLRH